MQTLSTALLEKYAPQTNTKAPTTFGESSIPVTTYGFAKITPLEQVVIVGLAEKEIEDVGEIPEEMKHVQDLDISRNEKITWKMVKEILKVWKELKILRLNYNQNITDLETLTSFVAPQVETLAIVKTNINTQQALEAISQALPNVSELQIALNSITKFYGAWHNLVTLSLEANTIDLDSLSSLPKLESLNVDSNKISKLSFSKDGFKQLKYLNISNNMIANWDSVHTIGLLPSLESLRFRKNPILNDTPIDDLHALLTARIGNISVLNGTNISTVERNDAERWYVKLAKKSSSLADHPRYLDLVSLHGEPSVASEVYAAENKRITKKIPNTANIRTISGMMYRIFGIASDVSSSLQIHYTRSGLELPLDDPGKEIGYYAVEEGDEIRFIAN